MRTSPEAPARRAASIAAKRAATPPGPALMAPAAARWVLDVVLSWMKGEPRTPCSCLLGPCGPCGRGDCRRGRDHDTCLNVARPSAWYGTTETWICNRRGMVHGPAVYLADRTCRYRCPCSCSTEPLPDPQPARPPAPGAPTRPLQLDLFGGAA